MNILILNGSPRTRGLVSQMLAGMADEARLHGCQVNEIQINRLKVRPCTGCMTCRSCSQCALPEDDAQRVLALLAEADALVIGSPCYWGNMNGELKVLFDRMVYGLMGESPKGLPRPLHKGKRAILVSTSSTPWPFNVWFNQTRGVIKALREILKWSGFTICGTIEKGGTKQHPQLTDKDLMRCRRMMSKLIK